MLYVANSYKYNDITHTANLWLAKTYIETQQYPKAEALLQALIVETAQNDKMPKYVRNNLELVLADYYIKQKQYDSAVKYLKGALLKNLNKETRVRTMFILGQIYEYQGDNRRAIEQFEAVIKKHPNYEVLRVGTVDCLSEHSGKSRLASASSLPKPTNWAG